MSYMNVGTLSRTELQLLNQLHCRRKRRHRTIFTDEQLEALENLFQETKYPDVGTREQLARKVHLREEKVEVSKTHLCLFPLYTTRSRLFKTLAKQQMSNGNKPCIGNAVCIICIILRRSQLRGAFDIIISIK